MRLYLHGLSNSQRPILQISSCGHEKLIDKFWETQIFSLQHRLLNFKTYYQDIVTRQHGTGIRVELQTKGIELRVQKYTSVHTIHSCLKGCRDNLMGQRIVCQQMILRLQIMHLQKNQVALSSSHTIHKKSKMDHRPTYM